MGLIGVLVRSGERREPIVPYAQRACHSAVAQHLPCLLRRQPHVAVKQTLYMALAEAELGTFYLTDFLLRHFERLVIRGLGLDRHPELFSIYFGNYRKLVYLAQAPGMQSREAAQAIATRMGLQFEYRQTGYGALGTALSAAVERGGEGREQVVTWHR